MRSFSTILLILISVLYRDGYTQSDDQVRLIDSHLLNARFDEVIKIVDAVPAKSQSNVLKNKKAEALTRLGDYNAAQLLLDALNPDIESDAALAALTHINRGFLQLSIGRSDLAEQTLNRALQILENARKDNSAEAAQALTNLGLVYMDQGRYAQAQEQLHRALSIRQSTPGIADELVAASLNDLGLAFSQTDKDKALDYFEKAQEMYLKLYGEQHAKTAIANINIGIVYRDLELYGDAVNNFENALKIWERVATGPHPAKALALYNLGQTSVKIGDNKSALQYYDRALKVYLETYGTRHPEVAAAYNAIGNVHVADRNFDAALEAYQQALIANVDKFDSKDIYVNPPLRGFYNGTRLLHTLLFKAQAFEKKYLQRTLKFAELDEALGILHKCDSLIDIIRHQSVNESDKMLLGVMANEVYADGVRLAYEAGINSVAKKPWFEKAFYFAEKSKGAVLLESISDANAKSFAGIPKELLEEEKTLRSNMALLARKLAEKPSVQEEELLRKDLFTTTRQYETFTQKLGRDYPSYFNLKYNTASPSTSQLKSLLNPGEALLSYFIDEKGAYLYIFTITHGKFKVHSRPLPPDLDRVITGLRNSIRFSEPETFRQTAYTLGKTLIPKLPGQTEDLIILPAGKLGLIPFETLINNERKGARSFSDLQFLIEDYSIRYEFSAGLMLQRSKTPGAMASPSIFLCAPVSFSETGLVTLPGTEKEVKEISSLFSAKNFSASALVGEKADEAIIKNGQLKDYSLLHFATHGIVDESNPELSRIFLHGNSADDGHLFAGEIYNLELNANLVTLSACQTGLGKVLKGEGVIGLSRALVYAGAKNIVVSYWNVADESTASLMTHFYENILDGRTGYSSALRKAKLDLMRQTKYSSPFYWAPFVLIGY